MNENETERNSLISQISDTFEECKYLSTMSQKEVETLVSLWDSLICTLTDDRLEKLPLSTLIAIAKISETLKAKKMITLYVLVGIDPWDGIECNWCYALERASLPIGGWANQGLEERIDIISVPPDDYRVQMAHTIE